MAINTECGSKRFMLLKATAAKVPIAATKPGCITSEVVCSKVFVARAFFMAERHGALVEANDTLTAFFLQAGRHRAAAGHLERGAERARAEHLDVSFQVADVEALPFDDASFDVVLSTVGVMFAPDHTRSAAEMLRVCRPGGRIGMANWTPEGFIGQLFKTLGRQIPPPAGVQPPSLWGVLAQLETLFGHQAAHMAITPRSHHFRYRSAAHFIDVFRTWYGSVHKAFAALPADKAQALEHDLTELLNRLNRLNRAGPASLVVPSIYLVL